MVDPHSDTYRVLYGDETGATIGLDEVQLLEQRSPDRTRALRELLSADDAVARFHSLLILVAWGDPAGLQAAERFLGRDTNDRDANDTVPGSSHRLHGYDMSYDELADALSLSVTNPEVDPGDLRPLAERLLNLFRTEAFESGLERFLTALADPSLEADVLQAIRDVTAQGRVRQAADLLPALAATNAELAWRTIDLFRVDDDYRPGAEAGVAFTLGRIDTPQALDQLHRLSRSDRPGAAVAAEMALRLRG